MHYISILSTIITAAFAIAVLTRYQRKGGLHLLHWGIGLIFYGLGTLTEVILSFTFSGLALKIWYLTGAMLTAAWLGQGTMHLLVRRRGVPMTLTWILAAVSLVAAVLVLAAPLTPAAASFNTAQPVSSQYHDILSRNGFTILLTILLNIYGTVTLVGGPIYSAFLFWRKRVLANRLLGNILIAAGALMPAMGGSFIKAGLADWLYVSELIGVILMYIGFRLSTAPQSLKSAVEAGAGAD